ncbi:Rv3235 family protein [Nocardioides sp.]|uniref:Rv3235 family protein n=1 Tax=Nocardioides sp. TaxID=35761 RepID=UPI00351758C3
MTLSSVDDTGHTDDRVIALHRDTAPSVQGALALEVLPRLLPPAPPATVRPAPAHRRSGDGSVTVLRERAVQDWARRYLQAVAEVIGGDRPVTQVARWTRREVYADLERRALLVARAAGHTPGVGRVQAVRPRVRSVHVLLLEDPTGVPRIAECSAHVQYGARSRAIAARFEHRRTAAGPTWLCTALEFA